MLPILLFLFPFKKGKLSLKRIKKYDNDDQRAKEIEAYGLMFYLKEESRQGIEIAVFSSLPSLEEFWHV